MRNSILFCFSILAVFSVNATLIHFVTINDCHSILEPHGPRDSLTLAASYGGYPRAMTVIDSLRAVYPEILVVHAGDLFTGDILTQATNGRAPFELWLEGGVEVFCLGNHEFDYGPGFFNSALEDMEVPLICANLDATGYSDLAGNLQPYRMFSFSKDDSGDSIKIAIIGVLTEETNGAGWITPLRVSDPIEALETFGVPEGADCAIALEHLDIAEDMLAAALPNISLVIGGHDHGTLFEPRWAYHDGDSTPVVMAGANLRYIGHLTMEYTDVAGLRFVDWTPILLGPSIPESPTARARLDIIRANVEDIVGLDPYETVAFIAESTILGWTSSYEGYEDTPLGNIVSDAYRASLGTDIAVEARGSLRMSPNYGPVTYADLFRAMPMGYDPISQLNSRLVRMEFTGSALLQLLEYTFVAVAISAEAFPQFSGLRLAYNPGGSFLNKIDRTRFFINDELWNPTEVYSFGGSELLIHAFELLSYPYPPVETTAVTAFEAIVDFCTRDDFVPVYHSVGRIINLATPVEEIVSRPIELSISAWPNPFNSSITIKIPAIKGLKAEIFDLLGEKITSLESSEGSCIWTPNKTAQSGVYLVRIEGYSQAKKIVLLK